MAIEGLNQKGWKDIPVTPLRKSLERLVRPIVRAQDISLVLNDLPVECEVIEPPTMGTDCEFYVFHKKGVVGKFARNSPVILKPELEDVVIYASDDLIKHVGVMSENEQVISKWGMFGPVIRHPLEMVPASYGDGVCFRRREKES